MTTSQPGGVQAPIVATRGPGVFTPEQMRGLAPAATDEPSVPDAEGRAIRAFSEEIALSRAGATRRFIDGRPVLLDQDTKTPAQPLPPEELCQRCPHRLLQRCALTRGMECLAGLGRACPTKPR